MSMRTEKVLIGMASVIIVLLLILLGMQFKCKRGFRRHGMKRHFFKMLDEVGATEEQKTKLIAAQQMHEEKMDALHDNIREARDALKDELGKETLDKELIKQKHAVLKELMFAKADYHLTMVLELSDILTPEQRLKVHKKMEKMHKRMGPPPGMPPIH